MLQCDDQWHDLLMLPHGFITNMEQWMRHIHPDDVALATAVDLERAREMMVSDERYHVDFRVVRADGEIRWWRSVARLVEDEQTGHCRALGCVNDITELIESGALHGATTEAVAEPPDPGAEDLPSCDSLSPRELECLKWVSQGKTAWETAMIIGRSPRTIEFHLLNAVRKLGASNKIHAAVIAVRQGLI